MATKKEIEEHLNIALKEIGKIVPWYDRSFKCWVFNHPAYPVDYTGDSKEEVIRNYPFYLKDFIEERLNDNLDPLIEKKTKGKGGIRAGAGRPKGSIKEPTQRVRLPLCIPKEIVEFMRNHPQVFCEESMKILRKYQK